MTDQRIAPPPAELIGPDGAPPEVRTIVAEVRSDASLPFDPKAAPNFLVLANVKFGALVQWRVDLSWSQAQQVQLWLKGAPAGGLFPTREEALKDFFENLRTGAPPKPFLDYVGTYLETGVSHAAYTMIVGMREPIPLDTYQAVFLAALNALLAAGPGGWPGELIDFMRLMLNQPTSREEFLNLASNIGDLARNGPPMIQKLLT
jgi:hypothetical protein